MKIKEVKRQVLVDKINEIAENQRSFTFDSQANKIGISRQYWQRIRGGLVDVKVETLISISIVLEFDFFRWLSNGLEDDGEHDISLIKTENKNLIEDIKRKDAIIKQYEKLINSKK